MAKKWHKLANEYVVSLFPVFTMIIAFNSKMKKVVGKNIKIIFEINKKQSEYYFLPDNWKTAHQNLVVKVKNRPKYLKRLFSRLVANGKKQIKWAAVAKKYSSKATNKQLLIYYNNFIKLNIATYQDGLQIPILDFQHTTFLSDEIKRILKEKKAEKFFGILTTPLQKTYYKTQELKLLEIYEKFQNNKKLKSAFLKADPNDLISKLKTEYPIFWKLINKHTNKYCWIIYVYEGPAADYSFFIEILKDLIRRKVNPSQELKKYTDTKRQLREKQKIILNELSLSEYQREIIIAARDSVYFKPLRRELQSWSYYYMETVLKEIAKRLHLSIGQVRFMLPEEISNALIFNKINTKEINKRMEYVLCLWQNGLKPLTGEKARKYAKKHINKEGKKISAKQLTGSVAYKGKVKGIVKLINMPEEMNKFNKGEVLVSAATSPSLMPAIRRASVIITDEGGLTCHAAIVSRELKIPCVIGTKIATKILKDGDKVEVDAYKGVVKKI